MISTAQSYPSCEVCHSAGERLRDLYGVQLCPNCYLEYRTKGAGRPRIPLLWPERVVPQTPAWIPYEVPQTLVPMVQGPSWLSPYIAR